MVVTRSVWGSAFAFGFGFGLTVFGGGLLGSAGRLLPCGRFGGGPLGSGGLMLSRALASTFGRAADEASKLAPGLAIGGGDTGRALALACSAASPARKKVSKAAASPLLMFSTSNVSPPSPAIGGGFAGVGAFEDELLDVAVAAVVAARPSPPLPNGSQQASLCTPFLHRLEPEVNGHVKHATRC